MRFQKYPVELGGTPKLLIGLRLSTPIPIQVLNLSLQILLTYIRIQA